MPKKRIIGEELLARMRELRRGGMALDKIAATCKVCETIVRDNVADVVVRKVAQGRPTHITDADLAQIRAELATGALRVDVAKVWHVSINRLRGMLNGLIAADLDEAVAEAATDRERPEFATWPPPRVLDKEAFYSLGIPDTADNRNACKGHSRAWMRLYQLRRLNPGYEGYGDSPDALSRVRGK